MRIARRILSCLVTAACAMAGSLVVAAPASAAASVSIQRSIYLAPTSTGIAMLGPRDIYLAAGYYQWTYSLSTPGDNMGGYDTRLIYLAADTYRWSCTLQGLGSGTVYPYQNDCTLIRSSNGAGAHLGNQDVFAGGAYYNWGTWLDPQF